VTRSVTWRMEGLRRRQELVLALHCCERVRRCINACLPPFHPDMVRVLYLEAGWAQALAQVLVGRDVPASRALIARYVVSNQQLVQQAMVTGSHSDVKEEGVCVRRGMNVRVLVRVCCRSGECSRRFCKLLGVHEGSGVLQMPPPSPRSVPQQLFKRGGGDRKASRPALRSTSSSTNIRLESTLPAPLPTGLSPGSRFSPRPLILPNAL
jgi:hypothetical protein